MLSTCSYKFLLYFMHSPGFGVLDGITMGTGSVVACPVTYSPGPMMVYALTLNVNVVLGGRALSVSAVVVELTVEFNVPLPLNRSSYTMITPFGTDGGLHETVSCVTAVVADRPDTGPGTVQPW